MRIACSIAAGLAVLSISAAAADLPASAKLTKALEGRTAGKPQNCVNLRELRSTQIIDHNTILFEGTRGTIWRNDPPGGCAGLMPGRILITRNFNNQMCSSDIAQLAETGSSMLMGSCPLGQFVPYNKANR